MTVTTTSRSVSYAGNGVTTVFAVPFYFLADADLRVQTVTGGVATTLVLTTNYTVTGAGIPAGGSVTLLTAPASGTTLIIDGNTARTQSLDLIEGGELPAASLETALDRLTMIMQEIAGSVDLGLRLPSAAIGVSATVGMPVANAVLAWNSTGTALESKTANDLGVLTTASSYTAQRFSGNGVTTTFTLSSDPLVEENTWVYVSGVYISKSAYSVSGTSLIFASAPASGTNNIEVVWGASTTVAVGTPSNGSVTPAKLSTGGISWDASGNVTIGGNVTPGGAVLEKRATAVASAATVNLSTLAGNFVHITGTTGISAITMLDGQECTVVFDGALTLTNGASLILPGGANLTTAASMIAVFRGDSGSVTRLVSYTRQASAITSSGLTMSTARLLGRGTAGTGAPEELTVGSGLQLVGTTLSTTTTGGGRTSIASGSLSGTTLSLTSIPATYAYLVLQITGMSFNAAATPTLRASTNNGVSYDSTAANYGGIRTNVDSVPTVTTAKIGTASMLESRALAGSDTCDVTITIKPYAGGTWAQWTAVISDSAGNVSTVIGVYKSTSAINALQLAGGTFDAGTYQFDGIS